MDPVSFSSIRQVLLKYQALKVLKSIKSISENNIPTLSNMKHAINSTNKYTYIEYTCVSILIFMLNHFLYEIIMYYNYFSKGHNVGITGWLSYVKFLWHLKSYCPEGCQMTP